MPTYSFRCKNCHETYDALTSYSNIEAVTCPSCGDTAKERVYKTAYRGPAACGPTNSGFT